MTAEEHERIAEELRASLDGTGVSQSDIAERLGMDKATLSRILSPMRTMDADFPERFRAARQEIAEERARKAREPVGVAP